jgi:hypothetical protein
MKNLYVTGFLAACVLASHTSTAQEPIAVRQTLLNKPLVFSRLPERSACNSAELQKVFYNKKTDSISLKLSAQLTFEGEVIEKVQHTPGSLSINVRSVNYPGSILNITFTSRPGKSPKITGRIFNPQSGDVLLLTEEKDQYFLLKQPQQFFMTE